MKNEKVTIIGANSQIIEPLIIQARKINIEIQKITRKDWDLSEPKVPHKILNSIQEFKPEHLIFSAGINKPFDINDRSKCLVEIIKEHMAVNCFSFISIVNELQSILHKKIITIHALSSLYGIYGRRTRLPYSVSKHAMEGAIKCLALEYPETSIIGYRPGFFKTRLTDANLSQQMQSKLINRIPKNRLGFSEEFSKIILDNIISPPTYQTGTSITIDGGITAGGFFEL